MNKFHRILAIVSIFAPTLSAAQETASMAQFTIAKSQVSEFAYELGAYDVCFEMVKNIRQNGITSDHAATLKVLYQGSASPQKVKLGFLEKLERSGYNFDQMFVLDELLTSEFNASRAAAINKMEAYDHDNTLLICSQARALPTKY